MTDLLKQLQALLKQKRSNQFYADKLDISVEEVKELLKELRDKQTQEDKEEYVIVGQDTNHETGNTTITAQSSSPLSPSEIESLAQVDNINTFVARSWLKSHKNDTWTYSIDIHYRISGFYTKDELKAKIELLLPDYSPVNKRPPIRDVPQLALFVYISDDHCGAVSDASIFGNEYDGEVYSERLGKVIDAIHRLNITYEHVHIIGMGDQMNGWNQNTTRGGHTVKSLSNKEQFDIYVKGRKRFYDDIYDLQITNDYHILSLENSNHSGMGFSYMADKALEYYVSGKYPSVHVKSTPLAIDFVTFGKHVFALTHGKDEKNQRIPFPLNLNDKTDALFYQYFDKKGYSAYEQFLHVMKADLHQYNVNMGKSCRYVNLPSMMGSNDYSEINFGDTRPGALIEVVSKFDNEIITVPIWF